MVRMLWLALLLGCGATSQGSGAAELGDDETNTESIDEAEANERSDGVAEVDPEGESEGLHAAECADRAAADCHATDGCVRLRDGTCRDATHECELIELERRPFAPLFNRGDPCQRENPACAWRSSTGLCAPFEAVPSCPTTAEAAAELTVFCDHSEQPALRCSYPGIECACQRPAHCGGRAPSPEQRSPPAHFTCVPDFDERGCPNREVREGTRCDVDPAVRCQLGCYAGYRCERGRWREYQLPPRP